MCFVQVIVNVFPNLVFCRVTRDDQDEHTLESLVDSSVATHVALSLSISHKAEKMNLSTI